MIIVKGFMLRNAKKKFNFTGLGIWLLVLAILAIPVLLAVLIDIGFIMLLVISCATVWAIGSYNLDEHDKSDLMYVTRNYKYSEIFKPRTYAGKEVVKNLAKLRNEYYNELQLLGGYESLFDETMNFLQIMDEKAKSTAYEDKDVRKLDQKLESIIVLCQKERTRAEQEQLKLLGRQTSTDVVDSMLSTAKKEWA